jgi:hypothetical protein
MFKNMAHHNYVERRRRLEARRVPEMDLKAMALTRMGDQHDGIIKAHALVTGRPSFHQQIAPSTTDIQ